LAFANTQAGSVTAVANDGSDPRDGFVVAATVPVGAEPRELVVEDLDNDGLAEIVSVNDAGNSVSVIVNRTQAGGALDLAPPVSIDADTVDRSPRSISAGDYDDDGDVDLSLVLDGVGDQPTRVVRVLRNDLSGGQIALVNALEAESGDAPLFVRSGDVDNDASSLADIVTVGDVGQSPIGRNGVTPDPVSALLGSLGCPGDTDGDNTVDLNDLLTVLANFGTTTTNGPADGDLDNSNTVDLNDLLEALANFGNTCQ
jgi:hypothetical protein